MKLFSNFMLSETFLQPKNPFELKHLERKIILITKILTTDTKSSSLPSRSCRSSNITSLSISSFRLLLSKKFKNRKYSTNDTITDEKAIDNSYNIFLKKFNRILCYLLLNMRSHVHMFTIANNSQLRHV